MYNSDFECRLRRLERIVVPLTAIAAICTAILMAHVIHDSMAFAELRAAVNGAYAGKTP